MWRMDYDELESKLEEIWGRKRELRRRIRVETRIIERLKLRQELRFWEAGMKRVKIAIRIKNAIEFGRSSTEVVFPFPRKVSYWYVAQALSVYPEKEAIPEDIAMTIGWTTGYTKRVLKEMEEVGLVRKVNEKYRLTVVGEGISRMTLPEFKAA